MRARERGARQAHELRLDAVRRVPAHTLAAKALRPSATPPRTDARARRTETRVSLSQSGNRNAAASPPSAASLTNAGVVFLSSPLVAVCTEACCIRKGVNTRRDIWRYYAALGTA